MIYPGSQPTYKEWKVEDSKGGLYSLHVPSLPTRNGKQSSYLCRCPHLPVPSLPTRNGKEPEMQVRSPSVAVPSLPTRNGKL